MKKKKGEINFADQLVSDLRQELRVQERTPVLEEAREGQEISRRQVPRRLILAMAMFGVLLLAAAIYTVRVQYTQSADQPAPLFAVEGEWLTPGPAPALELPEQQPIIPPPLPTLLPTPPVDMYSPLPPNMVEE